ncbi:hypothetical protein [Aquitalea sp. USM4]|uniref:hypothetical protein n=1 Tax=Aquitalea sp. USM4 TaxID=1590041 RepID=UPI00103A21D1|nr:hypothetical protein [Aquitalea sp. USM4]QBJ79241.1 hypothetical protein DKK66_14880 [Aquitalea sp. USM4]
MNLLLKHELEGPPASAAQLALRLHMNSSSELVVDLPEEWEGVVKEYTATHEISAGQLILRSLVARNELLAKYLFDRHFDRDEIDAAALFSIAHTLWVREIGHEDFVSGRLVSATQVHHDFFDLATKALEAGEHCFDIFNVLEATLRYTTSISFEKLLKFCKVQAIAIKGDLASGRFYSILESWLSRYPEVAREVLQREWSSINDDTVNLFAASLLALAPHFPREAVSLLLDEGNKGDFLEQHHKVWICGRLLLLPDLSATERNRLQLFILNGFAQFDEVTRLQAIGSATTVLHLTDQFDEALCEAAEKNKQAVLVAIGDSLFQHSTELYEQGRFLIWLPLLTQLESEHSLDGLDLALSKIFERSVEAQDLIIEFLSSWAIQNADDFPIDKKFAIKFDQCLLKISGQAALFAKVITNWLNHDDPKLAAVVAGMLGELELRGGPPVHFDPIIIESMSVEDLIFIGGRLLGFVHSTKQLLSLSLSMLDVAPESFPRVIPLLHTLIVDEIGYDYPSTTLKALESLIENDCRSEILEVLNQWKTSLESRIKETEELPRLNELKPSTHLQRQFALARAKQMEKSREEAAKQSIFRKIATQISLKAGKGCFSYHDGNFREPSQLSSFSYSIELPRREVLDPVGYAIRGYRLRTIKRSAK